MNLLKFQKQYKGLDYSKIVTKNIKADYFYAIKYDGNYVQIHKAGSVVKFFTSGGKEFYLQDVADKLVKDNPNTSFILEAEYIGLTDGKLGSRGKCTTTTWRVNFEKGIECNAGATQFKVFDVLYYSGSNHVYINGSESFETRLVNLSLYFDETPNITLVTWKFAPLDIVRTECSKLVREGWEGLFGFWSEHTIKTVGRSSFAVKFKEYPTADLVCKGVKYSPINQWDIGSLLLEDEEGRTCYAGGLPHNLKSENPEFFIGRVVEIKYESMGVNTYVQGSFVDFRDDK